MQLNSRFALVAAVVAICSRPRPRAGLSEPTHHPDRSLLGRRRQRPHGADRRRENEQDAGPADRDRNRGGAGGSIATRQIAKSAPDGYTLGLGGTGTLAINPTLYGNVGYDPRKDFAPVGLIATSALVVCVHPSLPVRSIPDLIALAKKDPGTLTYASAGTGSGIHLGSEYFAASAGIKLTHVPYKGSSPALTDLIGGHVAIYFSSLPPAVALVKEGKVRALAVTSAKRSPIFPDLPTVAEAALPGYEAVLHYGIVAPAGTPRPIIDKLGAALRAAVTSDELDRASPMMAPNRWRRRPRNTPPTSTARRRSGRRSSRRRARRWIE